MHEPSHADRSTLWSTAARRVCSRRRSSSNPRCGGLRRTRDWTANYRGGTAKRSRSGSTLETWVARKQADIGGYLQLRRRVPASLVEQNYGMRAWRDCARSLSRQRTTPWAARIGPSSTNCTQFTALFLLKPGCVAGSLAVHQPLGASGIEPQNPVSEGLQTDPTGASTVAPRTAVIDHCQRQQAVAPDERHPTASLIREAACSRSRPAAQSHPPWQASFVCHGESDFSRFGNPS